MTLLIFEIAVLGIVCSDVTADIFLADLECPLVLIEVANVAQQLTLDHQIGVCRLFMHEHLVWNLKDLAVSSEAASDAQIVFNYLHLLSNFTARTPILLCE